MTTSDPFHKMDHVVVLMFENRSFDNLLGQLYPFGSGPQIEGVGGKDLSNPIPAGHQPGPDGMIVRFHSVTNMDTPDPDPGEEHPHTNTQLYGIVSPRENATAPVDKMAPPYNAPPEPKPAPSMDGFVRDYINAFQAEVGRAPKYEEFAEIMTGYKTDQMPVLSAIAQGFACFDHWFCEVPSETYPNRSFFHAASSSGMVLNGPRFPLENDAETIFNRMERSDPPVKWRVYFDPSQVVSATGLIHAPRLFEYFPTRFFSIDDFCEDARRGTLPEYSFIEPCMIPPHSDMHPPGAARIRRLLPFLPRPAALLGGEALLARIYAAVRDSSSLAGSNFQNTLLIVTFDEHGGTYDHVPPPPAVPPVPGAPPGQLGFKFDMSGVRVPTVLISAWVDKGTVIHEEYRSTSVIRTLRSRWPTLGGPLTQRDASARDFTTILSRQTPRPRDEWPQVTPRKIPLVTKLLTRLDPSFSPLGRHLLGAALALEERKTGRKSGVDPGRGSRWQATRRLRGLTAASFPKARRSKP
jgi:phospholipase C